MRTQYTEADLKSLARVLDNVLNPRACDPADETAFVLIIYRADSPQMSQCATNAEAVSVLRAVRALVEGVNDGRHGPLE